MRSFRFSKEKFVLVFVPCALFAVALWIRLYGNNFGLPYAEEVDEPVIMDLAIGMLRQGDWNPHWFGYPGLYIYTQTFVTWLYFLWAHSQGALRSINQLSGIHYDVRWIPQPDLYIWARSVSAITGAITVVVLYGAGTRLYSRTIGLIAAVFFAFEFAHVQYSHFVRTDIPLTLFITITLFFAAGILKRGTRWNYALAGVGVGLTLASKYNGFPVILIVVAAHLAQITPQGAGISQVILHIWLDWRKHLPLLLSGLCTVIAFFVFNPFALLAPSEFFSAVRQTGDNYIFVGPQLDNALYYLNYFLLRGGFGEALTVLALGGWALTLLRHQRADVVAAIFPIGYLDVLLPWSIVNVRTALPLTPYLGLFAALALVIGVEWLARQMQAPRHWVTPVLAVITLLLLIAPIVKIQQLDADMALPTTRSQATDWVRKNLPTGARVLSEERGVQALPPLVHLAAQSLTDAQPENLQGQAVDYIVVADEVNAEERAMNPAFTLMRSFASSDPALGPTLRIFQIPAQPLALDLMNVNWNKNKYAPGENARLRIHWRAKEPLTENNLPFMRLLNSQNEIAYELAEEPQQGSGKMKRWTAGRVITDTHELALPTDLSAGRYTLQLGFYRDTHGFALPLVQNGSVVRALNAGSVKIAPRTDPVTNPPQHLLDARFGETIRLRGYTLDSDAITHGQPISLTLFWAADEEMEQSYIRFVHVLDANGKLVAQADGVPHGDYPTNVWDKDEPVAERVEIAIPPTLPSGQYTLEVGWYAQPSLERLRVNGDDKLVLTTVNLK
ncbi:MAG TPA: phospholipid carrier-dependent glycosyltransferase [Anaerolineae bacterium]|nr:phospholipid carrier-dependent glycosyltransferase [Anaerolineae bacterium]